MLVGTAFRGTLFRVAASNDYKAAFSELCRLGTEEPNG
jgi:hypothetical protein